MKPGDKPWFISIVFPNDTLKKDLINSSFVLKSLYFLQREMGDKINIGIIDSEDEFLREAFENRGIPQSFYIKDGKPYYMHWSQVGINRILEFIIRYDEIKEDAFRELHAVPNKITIYKHYYLNYIGGVAVRYFYYYMIGIVRETWQTADPNLKYWPTDWLEEFRLLYLDAYPKTSAFRLIRNYLLILLLQIVVLLLLITFCVRRCRCKRKTQKLE